MKQLDYCKICQNRTVTKANGVICNLTGEKPNFENSCPDFQEDEVQVKRLNRFKKSYNKKEIHFETARKMLLTGFPLTSIGALIYMMPTLNFNIGFLVLIGAIAFLAGIIFTMFGIIQFIGISKVKEKNQINSSEDFSDEDEVY